MEKEERKGLPDPEIVDTNFEGKGEYDNAESLEAEEEAGEYSITSKLEYGFSLTPGRKSVLYRYSLLTLTCWLSSLAQLVEHQHIKLRVNGTCMNV